MEHVLYLSALVRDTLEAVVVGAPAASRAAHLRGRLRLRPPVAGTMRDRLRERNGRR
jgi:hypothetical protein